MDSHSISGNLQAILEDLEIFKQLVREQNNKINSLQKELEEVRHQIGQGNAEQQKMNREEPFYQPHQPSPHFPGYYPPMFHPMYPCPQMQPHPYPQPQMQLDPESDESSSEQEKSVFENLFTLENLQMALNVLGDLNEKKEENESESESESETDEDKE
jgi:hypothetical protein